MTIVSDNTEITRRDFLKVVFTTATAAAVSGTAPLWPVDAIARLVSKPFDLALDEYNYLVDPSFDYGDIKLPTRREVLSLERLDPKALKKALEGQIGEIEHLVDDTQNWTLDEVEWWLDSEIEYEELGAWQAADYSPHRAGLSIYNSLSREDAQGLGLELVEGDHPGSSFVGVAYYGNVDELNRQLQRLGMNLVVSAG